MRWQHGRRPLSLCLFVFFLSTSVAMTSAAAEIRKASEPARDRYIVTVARHTADVDAAAKALAAQYGGRLLAVWKNALKGFWIEMPASNAERLARDGRVITIEEDAVVHTSASGEQKTGPNHGTPVPEIAKCPQKVDANGNVIIPEGPDPDPLWHLTRISHRNGYKSYPPCIADLAADETEEDYYSFRYSHDGNYGTGRVKVYLVDTGVWAIHPELAGATITNGFNAAGAPDYRYNPDVEPTPLAADPSSATAPCGGGLPGATSAAHGTLTASMIVGRNLGVARGVELISVASVSCTRVNGQLLSKSTAAVLISALDWVKTHATNNPGPAVVSISTFRQVCNPYGGGCAVGGLDVSELETVVNDLVDGGIPVFASANNQSDDACRGTPARLSMRGGRLTAVSGPRTRVITVGGTDRRDRRWDTALTKTEVGSNFGQCVDIFAPGAELAIALPDSENPPNHPYGYRNIQSGTSFSAPIVAAVAARLMAEDSTLWSTPKNTIVDRVWERLKANATPFEPKNLGVASPPWLVYLGGVTFKKQPPREVVLASGNAPLTVEVVGSGVTYQWYRETATVPEKVAGATGATLTVPVSADKKIYWVRATRTIGTRPYYADSWKTSVVQGPCPVPVITAQPAARWVSPGETVTLTATVNAGTADVSYQWVKVVQSTGADGTDASTTIDQPLPGGAGRINTGTQTVSINVTASDPPQQFGLLPTYRLILTPGPNCVPAEPMAWTVKSDTAQIRVQSLPAVPQLSLETTEKGPRLVASGVARARVRWFFKASAADAFTPLRINNLSFTEAQRNDGATWDVLEEPIMYPPVVGWYAAKALNDFGESALSTAMQVTNPCSFSAEGRSSSESYSNSVTKNVRSGETAKLEVRPAYEDAERAFQADVVVRWSDDAANHSTLRTVGPITSSITYTATLTQSRSGCERSVPFTLNVLPCAFQVERITSDPRLDMSQPEDVTFTVPHGSTFDLGTRLTSGTLNDPRFTWRNGSGTVLAETAGLRVTITEESTFEVEVDDRRSCTRKLRWKFRTVRCDLSLTGLVQGGSCGSDADSPFIVRGTLNKVARLSARITDWNGAALPAIQDPASPSTFVLNDLTYEWRVNGVLQSSGRGVEHGTYYHAITSAPASVELTVRSTGSCPASKFTFDVGANSLEPAPVCNLPKADCPQLQCRRRAVSHNLSGTNIILFTPGQVAVLGAPDETIPSTYRWYRRVGTTDTLIGQTEEITVTLDVAAEYYVITKNANGEEVSELLLALPAGGASAAVTVTPMTRTITAGQSTTFTATLDGADPATTQYEWRSGTNYERLSAPVIGRQRILTINPDDSGTYWCRVLQNAGLANQVVHNGPLVSVFVNCTNSVAGVATAHPQRLRRGERPMLVPAAMGKLLTYTWTRSTPASPAPVVFSTQHNPKPVVTDAVTTFGAEAQDVCGQKGNLTPVSVYLCVPTIDLQPAPVLAKAPTYPDAIAPSLSVTATPAIDGQALTVRWYRAADTQMASPLHTGTTFLPSIAPGSSDSFYAAITSTCGSQPHVIRSSPASVEVCKAPTFSTPITTRQTNPGIAVDLMVNSTEDSTFQWYVGQTGDVSAPLAGETSGHLRRAPLTTARYWCRVTNRGLCSKDSPTFTVEVCSAPRIDTHPVGRIVFPGQTATLTALASSQTHPVQYQWQVENTLGQWVDVANATSSTFTTPPATAAARYRVVARAAHCSSESDAATVSICSYPQTVTLPATADIAYNGTALLRFPLMYPLFESKSIRWYRGAAGDRTTLVRYATSATSLDYTTPALTATTSYWVEFEHNGCLTTSTATTVRVCRPYITASPVGRTISNGSSAPLSVTTTPIPGQTFQWYTGTPGTTTNPVTGATTASINVSPTTTTSYWVRVKGTCTPDAIADSAAATVTVCNPPAVSTVNMIRSIRSGQQTAVGVSATGPNLTFQWYLGARGTTTNAIYGATSSIHYVSPAVTTSYWCRVTSEGICTADSETMTVDVCNLPGITQEPAAAPPRVFAGSPSTLSVTATSSGPMTYQWYTGAPGSTAAPIAGATARTLTVNPTVETSYWVRVTTSVCSTDSAAVTVSICSYAPTVTLPATRDIASGESVTLQFPTVYPLNQSKSIRWYRGAAGDRTNLVRSTASASTLDFTTPALTANTQYWLEFEHLGCTTTSTATTVRVCKPTITAAPQSATILSGAAHILSATATGAPLTWQWFIGNSGDTTQPIAGATSASLSVTPPATTSYWVRATGCGTTADSATAVVTVCTAPAVTSLTKTSNYAIGTTGTLTVTATGTNLTYQWYQGQSGDVTAPIAGATSESYTFTLQTSQYYWVRVTSACNQASVNSAALLYSVAAKVLAYPSSVTIPRGTSTTLSVSATGTYLSYQWYGPNLTPIAGATSSTYTTPVLTANASYRVNVGSGDLSGSNGPSVTVSVCDGPTIISLTQTYNYGSTYRLTVAVHSPEYGLVDYHWYSGVPGDAARSTYLGESQYGHQQYFNVTTPTTYWVRVKYKDGSCYRDTAGKTLP
jgi:Ig-like domain CHU_C associated